MGCGSLAGSSWLLELWLSGFHTYLLFVFAGSSRGRRALSFLGFFRLTFVCKADGSCVLVPGFPPGLSSSGGRSPSFGRCLLRWPRVSLQSVVSCTSLSPAGFVSFLWFSRWVPFCFVELPPASQSWLRSEWPLSGFAFRPSVCQCSAPSWMSFATSESFRS